MQSRATLIALLVAVLISSLAGALVWWVSFKPGAEGSVSAEGPALGKWTMKADSCISGQREQFFGVTLLSDEDRRLAVKLVRNVGSEPLVILNIPGTDNAATLREPNCSIFKVDLSRGNSTFNSIWNMYGTLTLRCDVDGNRIAADVVMSNCH